MKQQFWERELHAADGAGWARRFIKPAFVTCAYPALVTSATAEGGVVMAVNGRGGEPATYGYARVSTREQNLDRQLEALEGFGVPRKDIWCDKASGKDFERPAWKELAGRLRPGDVLVVKSIDRLGRDYEDIIDQWRRITKDVGAAIVVLN